MQQTALSNLKIPNYSTPTRISYASLNLMDMMAIHEIIVKGWI